MNNKKKKIIIISIILGILVLTIGLTYAMFTISKYSSNSKLIAGDIYMHYKEASQGIKLENVLPSDTYDTTSYFEFTIDGKNTTTNKDIWYEILLKHGEDVTDKTRIKDNLLKFTLVEIKDGEETTVINDKSYGDLTKKRIWVNTINKNTTDEVNITYRLYMWISTDTKICAGDVQDTCDYYTDQDPNWNNIYASIKVEVAGDFNEKSLATAESCFTVGTIKTYTVNDNMTDEELNKCTTYITNLNWGWYYEETPEAFCKGTGTYDGDTFQKKLDNNRFTDEEFLYFETNNIVISTTGVAITDYDATCGTDVIIPKTIKGYPVTVIGNSETGILEQLSSKVNNYKFNDLNNYNIIYDTNLTAAELPNGSFQGKKITSVIMPDSVIKIDLVAFANNQLTNIEISDSVITIGGSAFANNQLTSVKIPDSITTIGSSAFANNQLTSIEIPDSVIMIDACAFYDNKLTSIAIPNSVSTIGDEAFKDNQLTSITMGENVTTIGNYAFANNKLTSVVMPNSVIKIDFYAFSDNQLTSITMGNGIEYINYAAFYKDDTSNPNLSKITINKSCSDIKAIPSFSKGYNTEYYPWLSVSSPYSSPGVTIYGSNNEVCDTY